VAGYRGEWVAVELHVGRDGEAFATWTDKRGVSPQQLPLPDDLSAGERAG
jgi:hypothetical protein